MPYSDKEHKTTNINYLNKDFSSLKSSLIEYTKSYFPDSYRDFNETSPGMMLIEMSAYVGDVLSFYIDSQYKEMMLPLAEERRNLVNLARMFGYKVKPISPAYTDLSVSQTVGVITDDPDNINPLYSEGQVIDKGLKITSTTDSSIIFETLDIVDFTVSGSFDIEPEISTRDTNGMVTEYKLTRKVKVISGETKETTVTVGVPEKFKRITLPENNIIEIISVIDSSGNKWYEVDYLAQDKIINETHYTEDRTSAYYDITNTQVEDVAVQYHLEYIKTPKRFITEINDDNTTSLVFGNGLLNTSTVNSLDAGFLDNEQIGIVIPGDTTNFAGDLASDIAITAHSSLGETPSNTTFTIKYRIGGGISANVAGNDLTLLNNGVIRLVDGNSVSPTVTNELPARGGSEGDNTEEIRRKTMATFKTQNRAVTKEDYISRVLSMPARFGNIAKVTVDREFTVADTVTVTQEMVGTDITPSLPANNYDIILYTLSYDNNRNLVDSPELLHTNLANYLTEYRILTDEIDIQSGLVVNFGVVFEVVAHKYSNKYEVKLRCIDKIIEYFDISKMQFRQPIYTNELIYEIMGLDGVRAINYLELTQDDLSDDSETIFSPGLWNNDVGNPTGGGNNDGYGWQYNFSEYYDGGISSDGVILPSVTPSVFELKNPNENVKGVVI